MSEPDTRTYPTRHGPMLGLAGDRFITRSLELYGEYCPAEWALLRQLVRPGMTVVEMGTNIGTHSVPLARACAPGPIYLFEPQQRIFQILCANLALNGVGNAIAYPDACGEAEGAAYIPRINYASQANFGGVGLRPEVADGVKVRVVALDALELPACHVMKIDVEGFEVQALKGAAETIRRCRPRIYVENDRKEHQQALISLLTEMGYRLYWDVPPLFSEDNYNGCAENVFPGVASLNMLCMPEESKTSVHELARIDPENWVSPFDRGR